MWARGDEARKEKDKAEHPATLLSQKERKLAAKTKAKCSLQESSTRWSGKSRPNVKLWHLQSKPKGRPCR
eukprot:12886674-Prorocentrum_lima.AAC.1